MLAGVDLPPMARAIREARAQAHLSQVELSAALRVRQSSVSQWERGVTLPSARNLLVLLRVLPALVEALAHMAAPGAPVQTLGSRGLPGP